MQLLATRLGMPELELGALCSPARPPRHVSDSERVGQALGIDPLYFLNPVTQSGAFQNGIGNTQKIKIGKAAAHELARQLSSWRHALEMANRLVAAREEIITLLRASYNRPN